jgi:hypothetical protein
MGVLVLTSKYSNTTDNILVAPNIKIFFLFVGSPPTTLILWNLTPLVYM